MGITSHESIFVLPNFLTTKDLWRIKEQNIKCAEVMSQRRPLLGCLTGMAALTAVWEMLLALPYSIIETDDVT